MFLSLLLYGPLAYLEFTYYKVNAGTVLTVDADNRQLTIIQNDILYNYKYNDIRVIYKYYDVWHARHFLFRPRKSNSLTADYGYIKIKFNDGNSFFFTSVMVDIPSFSIGVPHIVKSRYLTYLKKHDVNISKNRAIVKRLQQDKIRLFKGNYGDKSLKELNDILRHPEKISRIEIEAIKELLNEKSK